MIDIKKIPEALKDALGSVYIAASTTVDPGVKTVLVRVVLTHTKEALKMAGADAQELKVVDQNIVKWQEAILLYDDNDWSQAVSKCGEILDFVSHYIYMGCATVKRDAFKGVGATSKEGVSP